MRSPNRSAFTLEDRTNRCVMSFDSPIDEGFSAEDHGNVSLPSSTRSICNSVGPPLVLPSCEFDKSLPYNEHLSDNDDPNRPIDAESRIEFVRSDWNERDFNQGSQIITTDDSALVEDFTMELPSSFNFRVPSVTLAQLHSIRNGKNQRKKNRLLQKMGLSSNDDLISRSKKISLSSSSVRSNARSHTGMITRNDRLTFSAIS